MSPASNISRWQLCHEWFLHHSPALLCHVTCTKSTEPFLFMALFTEQRCGPGSIKTAGSGVYSLKPNTEPERSRPPRFCSTSLDNNGCFCKQLAADANSRPAQLNPNQELAARSSNAFLKPAGFSTDLYVKSCVFVCVCSFSGVCQ